MQILYYELGLHVLIFSVHTRIESELGVCYCEKHLKPRYIRLLPPEEHDGTKHWKEGKSCAAEQRLKKKKFFFFQDYRCLLTI